MQNGGPVPWKTLCQSRATAFVVGGVAWLILISVVIAGEIAELSSPMWFFPLFLLIGLIAAYVGLLGIYPQVKNGAPRLSLAGVGMVVVGAVLVTFAVLYTVGTGTVDEGPPFPVFPLIILSTILAFLLVGTAGIRTEVPSRTIGILVAVPGAAWLGDILFIVVRSALGIEEVAGIPLLVVPMASVVIASLAMVATGYLLRSVPAPTDRGEAAPDPTA